MAIRALGIGCLVAAVATGCSDPSESARPGLYRLQSVAGQPLPWLPPPSQGFLAPVTAGDLLLRSDGRFVMGVAGLLGAEPGWYSVSGSAIHFVLDRPRSGGGEATLAGAVAGGGVTVRLETVPVIGPVLDLAFVRGEMPDIPRASGVYVLTSLGGQPAPFSVTAGADLVLRIRFDTVEFSNGAFFRQHRREDFVFRPGAPDSTFSSHEYAVTGSISGDPTRLILRHYSGLHADRPIDTLTVTSDGFLRASGLQGLSESYARPAAVTASPRGH